ncbi:MAG: hypothetical protein NXI13_16385 [Proteobacteria bacterium]|nr:hypothetical protein [Pseudomonadota bacterium]
MRPFHKDRTGSYYAYQDKDETLDYTIDWKAWLNGDTISSVTYVTDSLTLTSSSNTTTAVTIWIQGTSGSITMTVTTAAGRIRQETITFRERVS